MFCVRVKPWLPTDTPVWVPFSWTQKMLQVWGQSGTFVKEQGSQDLDIRLQGTKGLSKRPMHIILKGLKPIYCSIRFYHSFGHLIVVKSSLSLRIQLTQAMLMM
jgi:hypothetical protein